MKQSRAEFLMCAARSRDRITQKINGIPFSDWLIDHPEIWEAFVDAVDRVFYVARHYSARAIIEVMRYESHVRDSGEFKINNNCAPAFARLYEEVYPQRAGFFEIRERAL